MSQNARSKKGSVEDKRTKRTRPRGSSCIQDFEGLPDDLTSERNRVCSQEPDAGADERKAYEEEERRKRRRRERFGIGDGCRLPLSERIRLSKKYITEDGTLRQFVYDDGVEEDTVDELQDNGLWGARLGRPIWLDDDLECAPTSSSTGAT